MCLCCPVVAFSCPQLPLFLLPSEVCEDLIIGSFSLKQVQRHLSNSVGLALPGCVQLAAADIRDTSGLPREPGLLCSFAWLHLPSSMPTQAFMPLQRQPCPTAMHGLSKMSVTRFSWYPGVKSPRFPLPHLSCLVCVCVCAFLVLKTGSPSVAQESLEHRATPCLRVLSIGISDVSHRVQLRCEF